MKRKTVFLIALAGQPNSGKSTVFNALTGAHQQAANWPGVTVDRKSGSCRIGGHTVEVVDLPGTYSLTSLSPEERVARDFLLSGEAALAVNIVDATGLTQGLTLTLELREMGIPLIVNLNMIDRAEKEGLVPDTSLLADKLRVPVVATAIKRRLGKRSLLQALANRLAVPQNSETLRIDYGPLEPWLEEIERKLLVEPGEPSPFPARWLAVKLLEGAGMKQGLCYSPDLEAFAAEQRKIIAERTGERPETHLARGRYRAAAAIAAACLHRKGPKGRPLSERIDDVVCHRLAGPIILVAVMFLLYYLSIVQGYRLTAYTWPLLAQVRQWVEAAVPAAGFIDIPLLRSFALWMTDSVNALLNYLPIFFILFALIAILEDSGYMPRMAFIMDRLLRRFGLHGQSVLPMVLGGVYVGGCAVPAVMACKGIPDERARLATMLTIPLLNCLAKVPLYVLLINAYFAPHKGFAMFFIASISLLVVLPVAKLLSLTVLRKKEEAPFVMEMPAYHLPTIRGTVAKAVARLWLYLRKIATVVVVVAAVIFVLLQFPGPTAEQASHDEDRKGKLLAGFAEAVAGTPYAALAGEEEIMPLLLYGESYRKARLKARNAGETASLHRRYAEQNPLFFRIVQPDGEPQAVKVNRAWRRLAAEREFLLADRRKERLENSLLGRLGKEMEPLTAGAGFDWRVNVALLSALAAKESSVATLGAIYAQEEGNAPLEGRLNAGASGLTPLHALALMIFMVLYPPCIGTAIVVKTQSGSVPWMLFSLAYPMFLGMAGATWVFSSGKLLALSGVQAMAAFYGLTLCLTMLAAIIGPRHRTGSLRGLQAGKIERVECSPPPRCPLPQREAKT